MSNESEIQFWSGDAGQKWRMHQVMLDTLFQGVANRLLEVANPQSGMTVVDVGCGTGALTLLVSAAVGNGGSVIAVDVSEPLLGLARERGVAQGRSNIRFERADAQVHVLPAGRADQLVSRFGVMFFEDPAAAFSNMLQWLTPGGQITFASWAVLADNPWFAVPRLAAVQRLGAPEAASPYAPGPMAFADTDRVCELLRSAGAAEVKAAVESVPLIVSGGAVDAATLACQVGPAVRIAKEKNGTTQDLQAIAGDVAIRFGQYVVGDQVQVPALINFYTCRRQ